MDYCIEEINGYNFDEWVKMALTLWSYNSEEGLREGFSNLLNSEKEKSLILE